MNLLEHFVLQHLQVTEVSAELIKSSREGGTQEARVELNLTPRPMKTDAGGALPAYMVNSRLSCFGGGEKQAGPQFTAKVGFDVVYQQTSGDPVDIAEFSANHASLTRQIYPLMQQELRAVLSRLGLEQIHLPFDLAARVTSSARQTIQVSGSVH